MSRYISFITLLVVIIVVVLLFYRVMAGFFVPLFLAALLVVIFRPVHVWILDRVRGRKKIAAMLTTAVIMLAVLVPLAVLFTLAAFESQQVLNQLNKATLLNLVSETRRKLNLELPPIANELNAVEVRLQNFGQIELLEDVSYLGHQLDNAALYNEELQEKANTDASESVAAVWEEYVAEFDELREIQDQIANRTDTETADFPGLPLTFEPDSAARSDESDSDLDGSDPDAGIESELTESELPRSSAQQLFDFQHQLAETVSAFSRFKVQVLGGSPFSVWLRELANPTPEVLEQYGSSAIGFVRNLLFNLGASTTSFLGRLLLGAAIMIISLYFFILDGPAMIDSVKSLSPIDDDHEQELIQEFGKVSRAVVVATLLAALVQALLGGIGYYFAGLDSVFLLTLLTGCLALVPFVGAAAVWVPCCLWLYFVENQLGAAIGLAIYGVVVISMADNLIKPLVLHGQSNLHPLLALLSVLGGVAALGPIGILIGPMIVAFLQTLLKILQREMTTLESNSQPAVS